MDVFFFFLPLSKNRRGLPERFKLTPQGTSRCESSRRWPTERARGSIGERASRFLCLLSALNFLFFFYFQKVKRGIFFEMVAVVRFLRRGNSESAALFFTTFSQLPLKYLL